METENISFTAIESQSLATNVATPSRIGYDADPISKAESSFRRRQVGDGKASTGRDAVSPEDRAAMRAAYGNLVKSAAMLERAALEDDSFTKFSAGSSFQRSLEERWRLRRVKLADHHWRAIMTGALGLSTQVRDRGGFDVLPPEACRAINELVTRCLSLSTKEKEETIESARLIRDAGFSPFGFIAADDYASEEGEPE